VNIPKSSLVCRIVTRVYVITKYMQANSKLEAIEFTGEYCIIKECALLNISQNTNKKYKSCIFFWYSNFRIYSISSFCLHLYSVIVCSYIFVLKYLISPKFDRHFFILWINLYNVIKYVLTLCCSNYFLQMSEDQIHVFRS